MQSPETHFRSKFVEIQMELTVLQAHSVSVSEKSRISGMPVLVGLACLAGLSLTVSWGPAHDIGIYMYIYITPSLGWVVLALPSSASFNDDIR